MDIMLVMSPMITFFSTELALDVNSGGWLVFNVYFFAELLRLLLAVAVFRLSTIVLVSPQRIDLIRLSLCHDPLCKLGHLCMS